MDYNVSVSALCESFGVVKKSTENFKPVEQVGTNGLFVVLAEAEVEEEGGVSSLQIYIGYIYI
jgi:hypothetical protein